MKHANPGTLEMVEYRLGVDRKPAHCEFEEFVP